MVMVVSTNLVPKGFSACALWPFIFIRAEYREDHSLIEHELVHYREQAWIMPAWVLAYFIFRRFRFGGEVRAYARQIELCGVTREEAAQALLSYRLGITFEDALQAFA